ncbi:MAG: hypothetical protein H0X33_14485 [Taibaiella sp.]|nr:hypothetical protein [Taibaiella sp.]
MADFNKAIPFVRVHEGGYCKVPGDAGGETYCGISRKDWPNWDGWPSVELAKPLRYNEVIQDSGLNDLVNTFYKKRFWDTLLGDQINSQKVAGFLLDWTVNAGRRAQITTQLLLGLTADGSFGPHTIAAINDQDEETFFEKLKAARIQHYHLIAKINPQDQQFLKGWLARVNDYA